jgi:curved DNA-binding protein CbpA
MGDYYQVLELPRGSTADEIKANYRRLAMKWHPDRNAGSREAEDQFKAISEAYSVLSDEASRRAYDEGLDSPRESGPSGGFSRGFQGFGGFSREQAADMFMREMYGLASELTMQNVGWREIALELVRRGCPEGTAIEIARRIEEQRKALIRGRARPYFLRSGLSGFFGLCLVSLFGGVGFGILGLIGLVMFLSGGYNLIRAIYFMTTGSAPRTLI